MYKELVEENKRLKEENRRLLEAVTYTPSICVGYLGEFVTVETKNKFMMTQVHGILSSISRHSIYVNGVLIPYENIQTVIKVS